MPGGLKKSAGRSRVVFGGVEISEAGSGRSGSGRVGSGQVSQSHGSGRVRFPTLMDRVGRGHPDKARPVKKTWCFTFTTLCWVGKKRNIVLKPAESHTPRPAQPTKKGGLCRMLKCGT